MARPRRENAESGETPGVHHSEEARYKSIFQHSAVSLWEEDIGELRRALRDLRARGVADLGAWIDSNPLFIDQAARMIRVVDVNEATLAMYEVADAESLRGPLETRLDLSDPMARGSMRENILAIWEGRTYCEEESNAVTTSGRRFDISIRMYIPPENDPYPYMLVNVLDISQRVRAEAALRESEERYRTLVENLGEGIVILDQLFRITFANPAAEGIFGLPAMALQGHDLADFLRQEPGDSVRARVESWGDGRPSSDEFELVRPDGQARRVLITATPRGDGKGASSGAFSIIRDMTDARITEAALRRSEEQLSQARKMEAVGRLAGGIAHDFNNLMTVVRGFAELVEESLPEASRARADIREVKRAVDRAADLTTQLLAFSRKQVLQPRIVNPNEIVRRMEKILPRVIGEDVEIRILAGQDTGNVRADPGQVEQVIMNLAVNARDAMPRGGTLLFQTANVGFDEAQAGTLAGMKPGSYVMLTVSDTGGGMDGETLARIFEPFFTTKELGKGTGLGLATVYGIIKQSGGFIYCESEPGKGATFRIYLPRVFEEQHRDASPLQERSPGRGAGTILLVEDEEALRRYIRVVLEQNGYSVLEAGSAVSALQAVISPPRRVHLLLTDVVLPQVSGPELGRRLRALQPDVKILYMSGYSESLVSRHGVLEPDAELIQKPFDAASLLFRVRKSLSSEGSLGG
ncbi:MAG: PAS domain S-box protein [Spirochaetia bacterium]|jgi:PAS domain S-box-containing protein